jgi:hypothetical protein
MSANAAARTAREPPITVADAIRSAAMNGPRLQVLITGYAGSGKTTLLSDIASKVAPKMSGIYLSPLDLTFLTSFRPPTPAYRPSATPRITKNRIRPREAATPTQQLGLTLRPSEALDPEAY